MNFDKKAHALKIEVSEIKDPDNNNDLFLIFRKNLSNAYLAGASEERQRVLDLVLPVLEFYAEKNNWVKTSVICRTEIHDSDFESFIKYSGSLCFTEWIGGKRARELLEKLRGET
jgi:hypothetical protein